MAPIKDASPSRHDREEARKDKRELPLHTSHRRAAGQGRLGLQYPQGNTNTLALCIASNGFASGGVQDTRGEPVLCWCDGELRCLQESSGRYRPAFTEGCRLVV